MKTTTKLKYIAAFVLFYSLFFFFAMHFALKIIDNYDKQHTTISTRK